jgi:hypothetical protein
MKLKIDRTSFDRWVLSYMSILIFCVLVFIPMTALAQDECFECHEDRELTSVDDQGIEYSLYVDQAVFKKSIHGDLDCQSCHSGISELPHDEKLPRVDCGICHSEEKEIYQWHGHLMKFYIRIINVPKPIP